jgi:hypothetical protein
MTIDSIRTVDQAGGGVVNTDSSVNNVTNSNQSTSDFKDMIQMLIPLFAMQSFSSMGSSSGDENSMGMDINSMIMPAMLNLLEKMMASQVSDSSTSEEQPATEIENASPISSLDDAKKVQINQFDAEREIGGDGINSNCGPTSLSMALHGLGLKVAGESDGSSNGEVVDLARRSMVSDPSRDGVGVNGQRSEAENNSFTNFNDLQQGAAAAGAKAEMINADSQSILDILQKEGNVVISGTFTGKYPLPWTGDLGIDEGGAPGHATMHIVAITGYDSASNQFIVNDPARRNPLLVDGKTLDYFMQGNAGAMAIFRN